MNQKEFEQLNESCIEALESFIIEAQETYRILHSLKRYLASSEQLHLIVKQGKREIEAHAAYLEARNRLFHLTGWGIKEPES